MFQMNDASPQIDRGVRPVSIWALVSCFLLSGCIAFSDLGEESTDISGIRVGMERSEVEAQLGACRGVEPDADGRLRCVYNVKDVNHRPIVRAGTFVADVLTLGLVTGVCGSGFACDMTDETFSRLHLVYGPEGRLESYHLEGEKPP